jgi:hypothetical protein
MTETSDPFAELTRRHGEQHARIERFEELLASTRAQCEHFLAEREDLKARVAKLEPLLDVGRALVDRLADALSDLGAQAASDYWVPLEWAAKEFGLHPTHVAGLPGYADHVEWLKAHPEFDTDRFNEYVASMNAANEQLAEKEGIE